ncbi:MAG: hypothetical protein LC803_21665 [Acidobacteria bacterium]|nr:hypothetical protein [Acidobacteriota bacterium]
MRANYFRLFGMLTLLLDLILFFFALDAVLNLRSSPGPSVKTLVSFVTVTMVGFGLLFLRKWAAIYFSLPLFLFGIWFFWTSIEQVPFPYNLLCMCEGLSLMLPLIVTVRIWPELTWGGKWFF